MKTVYVDLCFQGYLKGVAVEVSDDTDAAKFQEQLETGEKHLSLTDSIANADDSEIELSDFEVKADL